MTNSWPSWRYGPEGQAEIFKSLEQVPGGWVDHPAKIALADEPVLLDLGPEAPRRGRPRKIVEDQF